jgi:3-oxoacyl-(acyl-carrier-protein) synthase
MGIVSALGNSVQETWQALEKGKSALGPLTLFPSNRHAHVLVGEIKLDVALLSGLSTGSRSDHLAVYAARSAFNDARLDTLDAQMRAQIGIIMGTCTGGVMETEAFLEKMIRQGASEPELLRHQETQGPADAVAQHLCLAGFRTTVSTACSTGAVAIATACDLLNSGEARIVLAGGVDSLTRLTLNGFCSLLVVAPEGCRPFDARRGGMSLGEGAGMLILETEESALRRGVRILAYIAGIGNQCDAYHVTAPAPDGSGIFSAMVQALERAGMNPSDVGYINAHGTGTVDNDAAEAKAISRLFAGCTPLISSTKGFVGHTLAAAGAIEAIICILSLERQKAPQNLGLTQADPLVDFALVKEMTDVQMETALNNSIGFGGTNCSLIFHRPLSKKDRAE